MMMKRLFRSLLCLRASDLTTRLGNFAPIFPKKFSSQSEIKIINPEDNEHLQSPFAHFATSKFNMSPAKIDQMCKFFPGLKKLKTLEKVERFVCLLENVGCKPDQIAKIMISSPRNITTSVENVLQPKLQLLRESGIEEADMAKVLTFACKVLFGSLQHGLLPTIKLLKTTFKSHDLFIKAVLRTPRVLTLNQESLAKSLAFWEGCGFSGTDLAKFLYFQPHNLLCVSSFTPAQADLIRMIGVDKETKRYNNVLRVVMTHRIETVELKIRNLQLCGLSTEEIMKLFRACPEIFGFSTEKVRQTMQFLINDMGLPANSVLSHPLLLKKNLESVIKPRFLVLQAINSMNGLGPFDPKRLCTILRMPEAKFLCKIVEGHTEHMALYEVYEKAIAEISSGRKVSGGKKISMQAY